MQPTICEVGGVERQPAAQVLINPPAGLQEIFTLWTEEKRSDLQRSTSSQVQHVCATYRPELNWQLQIPLWKRIRAKCEQFIEVLTSLSKSQKLNCNLK